MSDEDYRKEDHTRLKGDGPKNDGKNHKALRIEKRGDLPEEQYLSFRFYRFEESRSCHVLDTEFVDQWELASSDFFSLNRRGRWNLLEEINKEEERTMALLKSGELEKEPLVITTVTSSRKSFEALGDLHHSFLKYPTTRKRPPRNRRVAAPAAPDDIFVPAPEPAPPAAASSSSSESDEDELLDADAQFEVVNTRKGRKVVEKGARGDRQKKLPSLVECRRIASLMPESKHYRGDLRVYVILATNVADVYKTWGRGKFSCKCWFCDGRPDKSSKERKKQEILSAAVLGRL